MARTSSPLDVWNPEAEEQGCTKIGIGAKTDRLRKSNSEPQSLATSTCQCHGRVQLRSQATCTNDYSSDGGVAVTRPGLKHVGAAEKRVSLVLIGAVNFSVLLMRQWCFRNRYTLTGKHALVDHASAADQNSITLHYAATFFKHDDVAGYQASDRNAYFLCKKKKKVKSYSIYGTIAAAMNSPMRQWAMNSPMRQGTTNCHTCTKTLIITTTMHEQTNNACLWHFCETFA